MIMNKLTKAIGAIALITMGLPTPALADYSQQGGMKSTDCFKKVYREEYIPGTGPSNPGRVRKYYERQRVACAPGNARRTPRPTWTEPEPHSGGAIQGSKNSHVDDNSCIEGSIIGGLAGGGLGGTLATKKNWIWSIPAGIIGGALVGCQVDGG